MSDDERDGDDGTASPIRSRHDWTVDSAFLAVVGAVAVAADSDPVELAPLHERVDPEALDALFSRTSAEGLSRNLCVTFVYEGYEVAVEGAGTVTVREAEGQHRSGPR